MLPAIPPSSFARRSLTRRETEGCPGTLLDAWSAERPYAAARSG